VKQRVVPVKLKELLRSSSACVMRPSWRRLLIPNGF